MEPEEISHSQVNKYFNEFQDTHYVANEMLGEHYPEDMDYTIQAVAELQQRDQPQASSQAHVSDQAQAASDQAQSSSQARSSDQPQASDQAQAASDQAQASDQAKDTSWYTIM